MPEDTPEDNGIACNDDACSTPSFTSAFVSSFSGTLPAGLYYVVVDGYSTNSGNYTLDISVVTNQMVVEDSELNETRNRNEYDFLGYNVYVGDAKNNDDVVEFTSYTVSNIVNGTDLIRRVLKKEAFGLTSPLITLASGAKMGKTERGAIWLNKDQLTPYDYWQFWRNTDDRDVKKFLYFFTEIVPEKLKNIFLEEKNINNLKILLANEATKILHGSEASKKAAQTAIDTFEKGALGKDLPEIKIKLKELEKGINIIDFIANYKILSSKSEARRAIINKGFKLDNVVVEDQKKILATKDFKENIMKLSFGKKKHFLIRII